MGGGFERQLGKTSLVHEVSTASPAAGKRTLTEQLPPCPDAHPVERLAHGPDAGAAVQRRTDPGSGDIVAMAGGSGAAAVVQRRSEPGALVTATET